MSVITSILSPQFMVANIELIAFVASVMILIFFDDFVSGKIIFPVADYIKFKLSKGIGTIYEKKQIKSSPAKHFRRYISEASATVMIILYCYIGYALLGVYIIEPLLQRWKGIITIVVLVMFFGVNYLVNNAKMRRKFFGFGIYNPEKK